MNKPRLLIRADANEKIGTGHIMRCIALAQEWTRQNGKVLFVSCLSNSPLLKRLYALNFEVCLLEKSYPDPQDAETVLARAQEQETAAIVLDGYHFQPDYHDKIRASKIKLMVIDDYNHLPVYHADILLNQNLGAQNIRYQTLPGTIRLSGAAFVMLRDEFTGVKKEVRPPGKTVKNVLVTMGGTDPDNTTLIVLNAFNLIQPDKFTIKIVLGPGNPHHDSICSGKQHSHHEVEIITDAGNMPELILWADIAVSAGGSTAWELLYLNVPSLFLVNADNQKRIVEQIEKADAGINAGWHGHLQAGALAEKLTALIENAPLREKIIHNSRRLIDGKGRKKLVLCLMHGIHNRSLKITVVSDKNSWITPFVLQLKDDLTQKGHEVKIHHLVSELGKGDIAFFLGCGQMVERQLLDLNTHNLVVHESDLPSGRGWSPLTWQILEGLNTIPVTLLEAEEKVDAGPVYLQETLNFKGHELVDELRQAQGDITIRLCRQFLDNYPASLASIRKQKGNESVYPRRFPKDSKLDISQTIEKQFNLMRVADNERYPLFFKINNHTYQLKISKVPGNANDAHKD